MLTVFGLLLTTQVNLGPPARFDSAGDLLPERAIARMGTLRLRHGDRVCGVCFSHDEKSLFSAGGDGFVRQWDVATGKMLREHAGPGLGFNAIAISPDGNTLAAAGGSADCRVYLWDAGSGKQLDVLKGEMVIKKLVFSPDSKTLAWITLENRLVLWDRTSKSKKVIRIVTDRATYCIAFSPDGKQLAVGDDGGMVRMIDSESGRISRQWQHKGQDVVASVNCIRFSHDGTKVATAGGLYTPIRVWDAKTGKVLHTLKLEWQLDYSISFSPDDKALISQHGRDIIFWDVASGKQHKTITLPARDYATDFAFSRSGKTLAVAHDGHAISLLDTESGRLLFPLEAHRGSVTSGFFLNGDRTVVSASLDGTIRLWNAHTGKQESEFSCGETWPQSLVLKTDGKTVLWGAFHKTIHALDTASGKETQVLKGHTLDVTSLAVSPDGSRLISAAGTVFRLWDLKTGKCIARQDHEYSIRGLAFLPDGKRFLAACSDRFHVCSVETLKSVGTLDGHTDWVASFSLSVDCTRLASRAYSLDHSIRIWDVEARRQLATIDVPDGVAALALSPGGKRLAFSRSYEPVITIWDIAAKKRVCTLKGHVGAVYSLRFSTDGQRLVSTGGDTTLIVWNVADGKKP